MDSGLSLLIGLSVVGMIGALIWSFIRRSNQVEALQEAARTRDWTYTEDARDMWERLGGRSEQPLKGASAGNAKDLLTIPVPGGTAASFDFTFTTSDGQNNSTTHPHHVVAYPLPGALPGLWLTREGFGAKLARAFGGEDIQTESAAFNEEWRLRADDPKLASDVVNPQMMQFLDGRSDTPFTIHDGWVFTWVRRRQEVEAIEPMVGTLAGFVERIPAFVYEQYRRP